MQKQESPLESKGETSEMFPTWLRGTRHGLALVSGLFYIYIIIIIIIIIEV